MVGLQRFRHFWPFILFTVRFYLSGWTRAITKEIDVFITKDTRWTNFLNIIFKRINMYTQEDNFIEN